MRSASICGLSAASLSRRAPDFGQRNSAESLHARAHFLDQIGHKRVQNPPQRFVNHQFGRGSGVAEERGVVESAEQRHGLAHLLDRKNAGVQPVVEIGGQIGNLVGQVDQLRLKRRKRVKKILGQLGVVRGGVIARVLHDALAHGERKIQPAKRRIALLEPRDDAQRVQVVVEAEAVRPQGAVERLFAGMAEGRMPDVVRQRQRLGQLRIQPQRRATVREICVTSSVCVRRLRKWSESPSAGRRVKTCVLPARRRKARACSMRAASRANGVR